MTDDRAKRRAEAEETMRLAQRTRVLEDALRECQKRRDSYAAEVSRLQKHVRRLEAAAFKQRVKDRAESVVIW